jgi:hypothetical protein
MQGGFNLLKNAGPRPTLHKGEKKKIMFLRILSIINRIFSLVYKVNSMKNVLI